MPPTVTVTLRFVVAAEASTMKLQLMVVAGWITQFDTVTRVPLTVTEAVLSKLVPVSVTATVFP